MLRIDRDGMIDDVITLVTSFLVMSFFAQTESTLSHNLLGKSKRMHEKDVIGFATFYLIGLFPTNHIIAQITICQFLVFSCKIKNFEFLRSSGKRHFKDTSAGLFSAQ